MTRISGYISLILLWLCSSAFVQPVFGSDTVIVAVAANFMRPMEEIAKSFQTETGINIKTVYASTGMLFAQIESGAPFDVFLAADKDRPDMLFDKDLCEKPFVYARGRLVFWSWEKTVSNEQSWQSVVNGPQIKRLAIANPEVAPYGIAAIKVLKKTGQFTAIAKKLVYGRNVVQAFQFSEQKVAEGAFTALSLMDDKALQTGKFWTVPETEPIPQSGCIVKQSGNRETPLKFVEYLNSEEGTKIIKQYGYW